MGERTKKSVKMPKEKCKNTLSQAPKPNSSQSINSPIAQILFLQRTLGNWKVQRMLKSGVIQTMLGIGQVAQLQSEENEILCGSAPDVQQSGGFRTKLAAGIQAAGTGLPLPEGERRSLECASGSNLSEVRVFDNPASHHTANLLNARAFTIGRSIYFGRNEYQPTTSTGRELLAHEAAHTIQHRGSSMPALEQLSVGKSNSAAEQYADAFARVFRHSTQVDAPSATAWQQFAAHGPAPTIQKKAETSSAEIMRTPRVDERMPDDLQGYARYVFPDGGLGVDHEVTPLDQNPTLSEGHPTLESNDHENGWTEFRSGNDADYSGWGTFTDAQYVHYPSRQVTDRYTDSNLQYFGRFCTSDVGFTEKGSTRTPEFINGVVRSTCDRPVLSPAGLLLQRTCNPESYYRSSPDFCRDDDFSPITHSGKTCYREIPSRSSYFNCPAGVHVCFDEEGVCEESPDRAAMASGKKVDGSCEWNIFCVITHIIEDVIPAILGSRWESQLDCVIAQGACTETRDAGIPTEEEIKRYNATCRRDTQYTGPDMFPTRDQCREYSGK